MFFYLLVLLEFRPAFTYTPTMNNYFEQVLENFEKSDIKKYPLSMSESEKKLLVFLDYQKKFCLEVIDQKIFESLVSSTEKRTVFKSDKAVCLKDLQEKHLKYVSADFKLKRDFLKQQRDLELEQLDNIEKQIKTSLIKEYKEQVPLKR